MFERGVQSVVSEVARAYWTGRLIVFAGANVAQVAGAPSWKDLVRYLSARARQIDGEPGRLAEIDTLLRQGHRAEVLSALNEALGMIEFGHCFEAFQSNVEINRAPLVQAIASLSPNLRAVLTPNMDFVLRRAFPTSWVPFANVTRDIPQRRRYILMLRGMLSDRSTWMVTREQYHRAWQHPERDDVLTSLYHTNQILFICHDFADCDIERIVDRVGGANSPQPPRHVALVPRGMTLHRRKRALAAAGIQVVEMGAAADGYADICAFLRTISTRSELADIAHSRATATNQTPVAVPESQGPSVADCPFPGLDYFDESRAEYFHGRQADISHLLQALGDTSAGHKRWLFIEGASGAGKSSLIRAGLIPKVRHGHLAGSFEQWIPVVMRPGTNPVTSLAFALHGAGYLPRGHTLAAVLAGFRASDTGLADHLRSYIPAGHGLLLVVDQLEEIFTLADEGERHALDALLACALADKGGPMYLITAMRGDFSRHLAELPLLETVLNREASRYHLANLGADGLTEAIVEPARRAGLVWDRLLVERILRDARPLHSDGSLPLVAHVLQALWLKRDGNRLTLAAYEELGGVAGAVTKSADELMEGFSIEERQLARKLLLCLAAVGPRGTFTRRPVRRDKALRAAGGGKRAERILIRLSGGRDGNKPDGATAASVRLLAVTRESERYRVDLVHEALLDCWQTLHTWLAESTKELLLHDDLKARLESWKRAGSSPRSLPSGAELAYLYQAMTIADQEERAFLEAAHRKEHRARLRLKGLIAFLLVAMTGVSLLMLLAAQQRVAAWKSVRAGHLAWQPTEPSLQAQERASQNERALPALAWTTRYREQRVAGSSRAPCSHARASTVPAISQENHAQSRRASSPATR